MKAYHFTVQATDSSGNEFGCKYGYTSSGKNEEDAINNLQIKFDYKIIESKFLHSFFQYGQWSVVIIRKNAGISWVNGLPLSDYVSIDVSGNWRATQGILYDENRECCAYDEPELLPKGLKKLIYDRAMKLLRKESYEGINV